MADHRIERMPGDSSNSHRRPGSMGNTELEKGEGPASQRRGSVGHSRRPSGYGDSSPKLKETFSPDRNLPESHSNIRRSSLGCPNSAKMGTETKSIYESRRQRRESLVKNEQKSPGNENETTDLKRNSRHRRRSSVGHSHCSDDSEEFHSNKPKVRKSQGKNEQPVVVDNSEKIDSKRHENIRRRSLGYCNSEDEKLGEDNSDQIDSKVRSSKRRGTQGYRNSEDEKEGKDNSKGSVRESRRRRSLGYRNSEDGNEGEDNSEQMDSKPRRSGRRRSLGYRKAEDENEGEHNSKGSIRESRRRSSLGYHNSEDENEDKDNSERIDSKPRRSGRRRSLGYRDSKDENEGEDNLKGSIRDSRRRKSLGHRNSEDENEGKDNSKGSIREGRRRRSLGYHNSEDENEGELNSSDHMNRFRRQRSAENFSRRRSSTGHCQRDDSNERPSLQHQRRNSQDTSRNIANDIKYNAKNNASENCSRRRGSLARSLHSSGHCKTADSDRRSMLRRHQSLSHIRQTHRNFENDLANEKPSLRRLGSSRNGFVMKAKLDNPASSTEESSTSTREDSGSERLSINQGQTARKSRDGLCRQQSSAQIAIWRLARLDDEEEWVGLEDVKTKLKKNGSKAA